MLSWLRNICTQRENHFVHVLCKILKTKHLGVPTLVRKLWHRLWEPSATPVLTETGNTELCLSESNHTNSWRQLIQSDNGSDQVGVGDWEANSAEMSSSQVLHSSLRVVLKGKLFTECLDLRVVHRRQAKLTGFTCSSNRLGTCAVTCNQLKGSNFSNYSKALLCSCLMRLCCCTGHGLNVASACACSPPVH